jgi:alpha-glucosidase (family GH31 glycosyl hydrolase)
MFGDSILVAPVLHANKAQFYLPAGKWTDFFTGEIISGPAWVVKEEYPIDMIPVYVRAGTVLLLGPEDVVIPDYEYGKVRLEARAYELEGEVEVLVPEGVGREIVARVRVGPDGVVDAAGLDVVFREQKDQTS